MSDRYASDSDTTGNGGPSGLLWFIVGGLVVAVALIGWFLAGGDLGLAGDGPRDVNITVQAPESGASSAPSGARDGAN